MALEISAEFSTKRFDIFMVQILRNPDLGAPREVYMAWPRETDIPRSLCEVTLFSDYVEWVHVDESHQRMGIATEVIQAIENYTGRKLILEGVTESGIAFVDHYSQRQTQSNTPVA